AAALSTRESQLTRDVGLRAAPLRVVARVGNGGVVGPIDVDVVGLDDEAKPGACADERRDADRVGLHFAVTVIRVALIREDGLEVVRASNASGGVVGHGLSVR